MSTDYQVFQASPEDRKTWDLLYQRFPGTLHVDSWEWKNLTENTYPLRNHWLILLQDGEPSGYLALTYTPHPIFGSYLATAPFGNYGGFYAEDNGGAHVLFQHAQLLLVDLDADYLIVRHALDGFDLPTGWIQDNSYATFILPLRLDPDEFFSSHIKSKQRNQIRKSLNQGFTYKIGANELFEDFWNILFKSMKELGSPAHKREYYEMMLLLFQHEMEFLVVYDQKNKPIGAALLFIHDKRAYLYHANVLSAYHSACAGDFLYWTIIELLSRRGIRSLDFGRSLINSGNEWFKMKYQPDRKVLSYWYYLKPGIPMPDLNQKNPKYSVAIKIWQNMPAQLAHFLGPKLIWGLL